jgi:tetratricopeptide (TPR) repeat protein
LGLAAICSLALLLRVAILDEFLRENPLAECPRVDAYTYWQMAQRMAEGQWVGETPFLSTPLYPYSLGVVRKLGGGLLTVYVLQLIVHLATGVLVAWVTRKRFGAMAGLLAAAIFFTLSEPAISCTRVLANSVQLLLVALLWWRWAVAAQHRCRWRDTLVVGALAGLLALAYPAALLLIPLCGLWVWSYGNWRWPAAGRALAGVAAALLVVSPATLHNLIAHGEFIPITAHSGITLRQGNNPEATGNITAIPGISMGREKMHRDAARQFQAVYGRDGTWREIDAHFRRAAIDHWLNNPLASLRLFVRKLYCYLTVRNYDDIMAVAIEREVGFANRAILAPIATPWLFGFALVGLLAVVRHPLRNAPEWLLTLLPLLVVLIFFYSPRYRLPALPLLCGLSAYAITHCRQFRVPTAIVIATFVLPLPLYVRNQIEGIDSPDRIRAHFLRELSEAQATVGDLRATAREHAQAEQRYRSALNLWDANFLAHEGLGRVYVQQRRVDDAIREYSEAVRINPRRLPSQYRLYNALCSRQRYAEAADVLERITMLAPRDVKALLALAWLRATCPDDAVRDGDAALHDALSAQRIAPPNRYDVLDVLAAAHAELGHFDQAVTLATAALEQARQRGRHQKAIEIERRLASYRDEKPWRASPRVIRVN